jgi:RNA polymerase sigma-70 factor, ECF subfamily
VTGPDGGRAAGDDDRDDRRLIADHLAGDRDAFGIVVRRHQQRLWAVALRTLGDREEAADALQDALISAFKGARSYRGDAAVTTWLHRIVVNACIDRTRRRAVRPSVPIEGHDPAQRGDDHSATEARLDVQSALSRLPAAQRLAVVLVDIEDLPVAEVAKLLDVAEGTVKSRCARARMALAAMLREKEPEAPDDPGDSGTGRNDHLSETPDTNREGNRKPGPRVGSERPDSLPAAPEPERR